MRGRRVAALVAVALLVSMAGLPAHAGSAGSGVEPAPEDSPDTTNPADVSVEMTTPSSPDVGETFSYTATVTNRGPTRAHDVMFSQSLSEPSDFVSVSSSGGDDVCAMHEETYDAEGLEGGPYVYREIRCELGNMALAEQSTIMVTATRTDPHEMWSSAWVSTSSYDDNYDNDWADVAIPGHASVTSDLSFTIDRPGGLPLVGDEFEYALTVTNDGPAAASDVIADAWVPEALAIRSITSGEGYDCTQSEYQSVTCEIGSLASGESTTVTIAVTRVRANEYWLGGSAWSSNYDPDYEDSYAEDYVEADKAVPADVGVKITGPDDPEVGSTFDYDIKVTNHGPSPATVVELKGSLPDGTDFVSVDPADACTIFEESYEGGEGEDGMPTKEFAPSTYVYRELRCDLGTLAPSESRNVTLTVTRTSEYELWNSVWVATASYDENPENDWDAVGAAGEGGGGCGVLSDDGAATDVECDYEGGDDGDSVDYVARSPKRVRSIRGGLGSDVMTIYVARSTKRHRKLVVNAGRGNDTIRLILAAGAGNITVVAKGGRGNDTIEVSAPRPGKRLRLKLWGGRGHDVCEAQRGNHYSKKIG